MSKFLCVEPASDHHTLFYVDSADTYNFIVEFHKKLDRHYGSGRADEFQFDIANDDEAVAEAENAVETAPFITAESLRNYTVQERMQALLKHPKALGELYISLMDGNFQQ